MAARTHVDFAGILRPQGALDPATALRPHRARLGERGAAHLLRRAGFGGTPNDVARYAAMGALEAVERLLALPPAGSVSPPAQAGAGGPLPRREVHRSITGLQRWWLDRMLTTPAPLQEKMALYFHGHFTSRATPRFPRITYNQNALFRRYALGNLRELTHAVSKDAAMLIYLNGANNVASHANENYARELMELFTLGVDHYTEPDVRESARAWTGWRVDRRTDTVSFDPARHDFGTKRFLGRTGNFDGDDIVEIIFAQPQCARFFAASLLSWFVYDNPEPQLVEAVAALLRRHDFELAPVVGTILGSEVFYGPRAYRALVKSPAEFVIGTYKVLGRSFVDEGAVTAMTQMGQRLFFPPTVAGWPGGENWLTSGTMIARQNFLTRLLGSRALTGSPWLHGLPLDSARVAGMLARTILQGDIAVAALADLESYLNGAGSAALAPLTGENYDQRVTGAVYLAMATPAYQLN